MSTQSHYQGDSQVATWDYKRSLAAIGCPPPTPLGLSCGCIIRSCFVHQLPPGARVSKDCRDLLLRLLERNPDARITFAEFFAHPFVDMEHMPSPESLVKAVREREREKEGKT